MSGDDDKIVVENVNHPGKSNRVGRVKYQAIRKVLVTALPKADPGLTQSEMIAAVKRAAPDDLFPGGSTAGWWCKTVQLDLEAKGVMVRQAGKPTRWRLVG